MSAIDMIYNNFNSNRATIEKWLSYPRQLQQEYGINPVLAGGAIRDIILGGEVNDLDVFVSVSSWLGNDENTWDEIAELEGWEYHRPRYLTDHSQDILAIYKFKSEFLDKPYNITVLNTDSSSADIIKDFNFGINMIAVNTYSMIAADKKFIADVEEQRVTINNEQKRGILTEAYTKLLEKYPALPLISPEGLELDKPNAGLILPPGVR